MDPLSLKLASTKVGPASLPYAPPGLKLTGATPTQPQR